MSSRGEIDSPWRAELRRNLRPRTYCRLAVSDPRVRPLPYPYRGALAISNDAEFLQWEFFDALMRFVNTRESTPFGAGLGLRLTSSLFFHSVPSYNLAYFDGAEPGARRSRYAEYLEAYLRAGWIDTVHAYGDFDGAGGFTRAHANAAFHALDAIGVRLEVFSNHGSEANVQNVGVDAEYHRGDHTGHAAYHADLLAEHGVRYVWTDSLVLPESRRRGLRAALIGRERTRLPELVMPWSLRDGREFLGFRRFRGTATCAPNLSSWHAQVAQLEWERMYADWGATIVYQHFGVLQRVAGECEAATIAKVLRRPELYLAPFRVLQREQERGALWVCGCAELLRYAEMIREVKITPGPQPWEFVLSFPRPVSEPAKFFAGLTLAADPRERVSVVYAGRELATAWNGPDQAGSGTYSVTVLSSPLRIPA